MTTHQMTTAAQVGIIEAIKQVGFPIVVAVVLIYIGTREIDRASVRFDKQSEYITGTLSQQLEKSNIVITAIDQTLKANAVEQRETRAVLREVLTEFREDERPNQ